MGRYDPILQALMGGQNQALQLRRDALDQPRPVERFMAGLRSGQERLAQSKEQKLKELLNRQSMEDRQRKMQMEMEDREYDISQRPLNERSKMADIDFKEGQTQLMTTPKPPQAPEIEYGADGTGYSWDPGTKQWNPVIAADGRPLKKYQPPEKPSSQTGRWVQIQGEPGEPARRMNTLTGEVEFITQGGAPVLKPTKDLPPALHTSITGNKNSLNEIDQAIAEIDKPETAGSLGLSVGGLAPDAIAQRWDPEGVKARALVAKISAVKIHDLTGATQTVGEVARLRPFLPRTSDTPQVIKQKLELLRGEIANMLTQAEQSYSPERGYKPGNVATGGASTQGKRNYEGEVSASGKFVFRGGKWVAR